MSNPLLGRGTRLTYRPRAGLHTCWTCLLHRHFSRSPPLSPIRRVLSKTNYDIPRRPPLQTEVGSETSTSPVTSSPPSSPSPSPQNYDGEQSEPAVGEDIGDVSSFKSLKDALTSRVRELAAGHKEKDDTTTKSKDQSKSRDEKDGANDDQGDAQSKVKAKRRPKASSTTTPIIPSGLIEPAKITATCKSTTNRLLSIPAADPTSIGHQTASSSRAFLWPRSCSVQVIVFSSPRCKRALS
jgi:hypothetical protein